MQGNASIESSKTKAYELRCNDSLTLPGETEVDSDLLSRAVSQLNRIYISNGIETARAIGSYVVETFFNGNIENFRRRKSGHVTFRALADRRELAMRYNTIWYSVAVLDQIRFLPNDIVESLTLAHHKLLLPIKDTNAKITLAKKAIDNNLSSREFAEVIRKLKSKSNNTRYRKKSRLPFLLKNIKSISRTIEGLLYEKDTEELHKLVSELDSLFIVVDKLKEKASVNGTKGGTKLHTLPS